MKDMCVEEFFELLPRLQGEVAMLVRGQRCRISVAQNPFLHVHVIVGQGSQRIDWPQSVCGMRLVPMVLPFRERKTLARVLGDADYSRRFIESRCLRCEVKSRPDEQIDLDPLLRGLSRDDVR